MNEKLYEALDVCIQAVETGADIESVLKRYPQMADELRPILEASIQAGSLAVPSVPEDAMRRGRARLLQHAAEMRESAVKPRKASFSFSHLATALALAFIFIISGSGLVRASDGALPGDNLYSVKRTWEDMRLLLVFSSESREEMEDEFEQERLHEVDELLAEGRHETIVFAGLVTEQNENNWVVSGISVQITPESKLPAEPVTIGVSIIVEGHTNLQGFVEADRVELIEPGISLPPLEPVEVEDSKVENDYINDENEAEIESLKEAYENGNDDNTNDDDANDNSNGNSDRDDNANKNSNDSNDNDGNTNENSNDDNSNENEEEEEDEEPDEPDDD